MTIHFNGLQGFYVTAIQKNEQNRMDVLGPFPYTCLIYDGCHRIQINSRIILSIEPKNSMP